MPSEFVRASVSPINRLSFGSSYLCGFPMDFYHPLLGEKKLGMVMGKLSEGVCGDGISIWVRT